MNAWNNNGDICWMDGIVFADCDNYANTGVGCFEIYKNHGFRNCEFRDIRHGKAIGYFEACKMVNCLFYNLHSQNYLIRANNSQLYNVTIANSLSDGWNSNYFHGGTKLHNTLIWNIKITGGSRTRAVVCGGDIPAVNCAIMNGLTEKDSFAAAVLNCQLIIVHPVVLIYQSYGQYTGLFTRGRLGMY